MAEIVHFAEALQSVFLAECKKLLSSVSPWKSLHLATGGEQRACKEIDVHNGLTLIIPQFCYIPS